MVCFNISIPISGNLWIGIRLFDAVTARAGSSRRRKTSSGPIAAGAEQLESRQLLTVFAPTNGAQLAADVAAANSNNDVTNTIVLPPVTTR